MSGNGWIKLHRKMQEHDWLARDPVAKAAWVDILLATEWDGPDAGFVTLSPDDIPTRACVTRDVWRRIVRRFVSEGMLRLDVMRGRGRGRGSEQRAYVTKFHEYQEVRADRTHTPSARTQQAPPYSESESASSTALSGSGAVRNPHRNPKTPTVSPTVSPTVTRAAPASGTQMRGAFSSNPPTVTPGVIPPSSRPKTLEEVQEERQGHERTMRGASPVASPPAERAHPSTELDIDQEPARKPLAPDAVDMDPRLHPEHALMDRMNGKPTAMQEEIAARSFFVRLLGAANAKNPQVQPRMRAWHQQYGEKYIESVWDEARNRPDPKNARKTPLYYLVDALNGQFFPRAAAERDIALAAAREPDPALEPGALVTLPNGEQRVLDTVAGVWSYLEGVPGVVRTADLRPVLEARP
jgi:hypothetical protein